MQSPSGHTRSLWIDHENLSKHPPLDSSPSVDVCILGAGISGLTAAYLLLKAGKSVVVLERNRIAGGDTGRTTAHLSPIMDDGLAEIERWHGEKGAKLVLASHAEAISEIETIIANEKIDADFKRVDAYLFGEIDDEFAAAKRVGVKVERVVQAPLRSSAATSSEDFNTGPALKFPDQARFHVVKYLRGLVRAITALGGKIYEDTAATEVEWDEIATVKTESRHRVKARFVIEGANSLVTGKIRTITKLYPYRTYVVGIQVPQGSVPDALFWDTEDPYHYVRLQPAPKNSAEPDLLIVGGEDHKTGQAEDMEERYRNLERWARDRWPKLGGVTYRWSGQVLETPDGLALIGVNPGNPDNSFLISGDSGHGITHGTLGAMIVTDAILGRTNPYRDLYSPSRFHPSSLGTWVSENANVGRQYLDWLPLARSISVDAIPKGQGAVVSDGLQKIAVHRDAHGKLSACSAVCPHLGAIVRWNPGEGTWDCPAHGSRFAADGRAIATPTISDLPKCRAPAAKG